MRDFALVSFFKCSVLLFFVLLSLPSSLPFSGCWQRRVNARCHSQWCVCLSEQNQNQLLPLVSSKTGYLSALSEKCAVELVWTARNSAFHPSYGFLSLVCAWRKRMYALWTHSIFIVSALVLSCVLHQRHTAFLYLSFLSLLGLSGRWWGRSASRNTNSSCTSEALRYAVQQACPISCVGGTPFKRVL